MRWAVPPAPTQTCAGGPTPSDSHRPAWAAPARGKERRVLSNTQIQRYIRLTNLVPELLDMVDNTVLKEKGTAVNHDNDGFIVCQFPDDTGHRGQFRQLELLDMVDNTVLKEKGTLQMALRPAVELSYLPENSPFPACGTSPTPSRWCPRSSVRASPQGKTCRYGSGAF